MPLRSNIKQAFNRGVGVGVVAYLIIAAIAYFYSHNSALINVATYALGGIVSVYGGYFAYRRALYIQKANVVASG